MQVSSDVISAEDVRQVVCNKLHSFLFLIVLTKNYEFLGTGRKIFLPFFHSARLDLVKYRRSHNF